MKSESVDPRRELMYVRTFGGSALGQIENYEEIVVRTKKDLEEVVPTLVPEFFFIE